MVSKRERLEAIIQGELADRPAIALWRHFPVDDQDPVTFSKASLKYQERNDFDLLKVTPASSYCLRDWGAQDQWRGNFYGTRDYSQRVIQVPEDWTKLAVLDPGRGQLGLMLEALQQIVQGAQGKFPVLQTIFNPLAQAKNLAGNDRLLEHIRSSPEFVLQGLETITLTTMAFIDSLKALDIDGIFFAVQHASYRYFDEPSYKRFGEAFDTRVMEVTEDLWFNMLHLHGEAVMFDLASRLPCQVVNWHDRETPPSLSEGGARFPGGVCGGLRRWDTLVLGTPSQVIDESRDAIQALGGRGLVLGAGCVTPLIAPDANIAALKEAVNYA